MSESLIVRQADKSGMWLLGIREDPSCAWKLCKSPPNNQLFLGVRKRKSGVNLMKKKLLSIFLVVCVILCAAPITTVPAAAVNISFSVIDGTNSHTSTENWDKLMDSNTGTKWCLNLDEASGGVYVIFKASESSCVTGYTFTTGNDTAKLPGRNPKNWILYGCNNYNETTKKGNWEAIHTVTNDSTMPSANNTAQSFSFTNTTNYQYYKFVFTKTKGEKMLQLSEISFTASLDLYDVYINDLKFKSSNTKFTSNGVGDGKAYIQSGFAEYYPETRTLRLENLQVTSVGSEASVIYSNVPGLKIVCIGTNTVTINKSTDRCAAIAAMSDCMITGDTFAVNLANRSTATSSNGTNRMAIMAAQSLTIEDGITIDMKDNSESAYANQASLIEVGGDLKLGKCKLSGKNLLLGIYTTPDYSFNASETVFAFQGTKTTGLLLSGESMLEQCTGSIIGYAGIYSYAYTALSGCNMSFKSSKAALTADNAENLGAVLCLYSSNLTIYDSYTGIQAIDGGTVVAQRGTYNIDVNSTNPAVMIDPGSKLLFHAGTLNLKLTTGNTASPKAFSVNGDLNINGGLVTTSADFSQAICNDGTGTVKFYGGTHTLSASKVAYLSNNKNNLIIENNANVTFTAERAINHDNKENAPGTFTMTGGTVNLNYTSAGLLSVHDAGISKITGGTLNFNGTASDKTLFGIYDGKFEIGGTADVNFSGNTIDIRVNSAGNKISGGDVSFSANTYGLYLLANFEISGGKVEMNSSVDENINIFLSKGDLKISGGDININNTGASAFNIAALQNTTCTLSGGKLTTNCQQYASLLSQGGVYSFAGTDATITGIWGWVTNGNGGSFNISGGKVVFIGQYKATLSGMYSSIADGYAVFAGENENSASKVSNVTDSTFTGNKYVCIKNINIRYTLTLENVQGGATSASYKEGDTFSYTAAAASEGQHFDHWELTVNGTTSNVGTNSTYNGTMSDSDATLKAVYASCYGGTAYCVKRAICEYCNKEYGGYANAHTYVVKNRQNGFDYEHYAKCTVCGKESQSEPCRGGITSCTERPICEVCGYVYGQIPGHSARSVYVDDSVHHNYCSRCNEDLGTETHYGKRNDATDTEPASCYACAARYYEIKAKEGCEATIHYNSRIIYNILPGTTDLTDCIDVTDRFHLEYSSIGTGQKVTVRNDAGRIANIYTVLIYGDINGDGWYDGEDAVYVNMIMNNMLTEDSLGSVQWQAADCNKDGNIDATDYQILSDAGVLLNNINQSTTNLSSQSAYAEYLELTGLELPAENPFVDDAENQPIETDKNPSDSIFLAFISFFEDIFKWLFGWIIK